MLAVKVLNCINSSYCADQWTAFPFVVSFSIFILKVLYSIHQQVILSLKAVYFFRNWPHILERCQLMKENWRCIESHTVFDKRISDSTLKFRIGLHPLKKKVRKFFFKFSLSLTGAFIFCFILYFTPNIRVQLHYTAFSGVFKCSRSQPVAKEITVLSSSKFQPENYFYGTLCFVYLNSVIF